MTPEQGRGAADEGADRGAADEGADRGAPERQLPSPGPSFARAEPLRLRAPAGEPGARVRLGMLKPSIMEDGWWLTTLWVEDDGGVIEARTVAPAGGPPPGTPLQVIGPALSGALMGLLDQADGRQLIRMRMTPADDETDLWRRPLLILLAVRWDPIRSSTLTEYALAGELMRAFRHAINVAGSPGRVGSGTVEKAPG
jgi:hypothetical protein